ncbi:MAG: flagellar motor switch protein FliN [Planctomycetaceae bacterium]|jgi:flagellar motor switch protein FliN/FliY|nr:flagellar motor switch protein FliN [Planctomycetaceae bacterium]
MSDDSALNQDEIERLLSGGGGAKSPPPPPPPPAPAEDGGLLGQAELDALLAGTGGGVSSASSSPLPPPQPSMPTFAPPSPAATLDQNDIESLLKNAPVPQYTPAPPQAPPPPQHSPIVPTMSPMVFPQVDVHASLADEDGIPQGDIDYLYKRASDAVDSIAKERIDLPTEIIEFQFPEFGGTVPNSDHATLDQISEVELEVTIELGRTNIYIEDVLKLRKGSVVPLDKLAGETVDIYVNKRKLARGEVLVMNENFCVRVGELLAGAIPLE